MTVTRDGQPPLELYSAQPFAYCAADVAGFYGLWNAIVTAIRSPDYDTSRYIFVCPPI